MLIKGKARVNNKEIEVFGTINIVSYEHKKAYISWQINDNANNRIAGVSKNFYFESDDIVKKDIIEKVIIDITKYRISREKIFSDIHLVSEL